MYCYTHLKCMNNTIDNKRMKFNVGSEFKYFLFLIMKFSLIISTAAKSPAFFSCGGTNPT